MDERDLKTLAKIFDQHLRLEASLFGESRQYLRTAGYVPSHDPMLIRLIERITGVSRYSYNKWLCSGEDMEDIIRIVSPFMIDKREMAQSWLRLRDFVGRVKRGRVGRFENRFKDHDQQFLEDSVADWNSLYSSGIKRGRPRKITRHPPKPCSGAEHGGEESHE